MPQFDPSTFASQIFWLALTFTVLYLLMAKLFMPKIGDVLDQRQKRIDGNLDKANELKAETEAAIAAYEKAQTEARGYATSVMKETSERLAKESEARNRELSQRLEAQIKEGEARVMKAKAEALQQVAAAASDVAGAIVGKIAGFAPTADQVQASVNNKLAKGG